MKQSAANDNKRNNTIHSSETMSADKVTEQRPRQRLKQRHTDRLKRKEDPSDVFDVSINVSKEIPTTTDQKAF